MEAFTHQPGQIHLEPNIIIITSLHVHSGRGSKVWGTRPSETMQDHIPVLHVENRNVILHGLTHVHVACAPSWLLLVRLRDIPVQ